MSSQNRRPSANNQSNGKYTIIAALISGISVIIAAIIGIFSYDLNKTNEILLTQKNELQIQINVLQKEIIEIQNNLNNMRTNNESNLNNHTGEKVSIFNLDTFQGIAYWFDRSNADSNLTFIDTYDNEYSTAYFGCTRPSNKDKYSPTYLLDKKYSVFEGQLAWSKISKNIEGKVWLEFYSGNDLIYQTDAISATDRVITFEFDVKDVETLTIVANGSNPPLYGIIVIYPYLNLISK